MKRTTIICGCGSLADVVDKAIVAHRDPGGNFCGRSGDRYVPSPSGVSGNDRFEILAQAEIPCPVCHEHPIGGVALIKDNGSEQDYSDSGKVN